MEAITAANGTVIKWARETCNMSIENVAARLGKDPKAILDWEVGEGFPTYIQLEQLGDLYKKPVALFFFPGIPDVPMPKSSCRSLPEHVYDTLSHKVVLKIHEAQVLQLNLHELHNGVNPMTLVTKRPFSDSVRARARELRDILSISLAEQKKQRKDDEALEMWRSAFAENGIYVFKEAFEDDRISGFCLTDVVFPVIFLNNTMSFTRQIFTLFHEFYHLLSATSGLASTREDFTESFTAQQLQLEIECNQFAGEFLVPGVDLINEVRNRAINETLVELLAGKYNVSREVIARRFLDLGLFSTEDYESRQEAYSGDVTRSRRKDGARKGHYYNTKVAYLGHKYLNLVFGQHAQSKIDMFQLSEYTKTKVEHLPKLEATLRGRNV